MSGDYHHLLATAMKYCEVIDMGTYVYGLSGDFKNASLNGQKVRVCAYRFLYKESFDGPSQRLRKKAQRAEERHDRLNPATPQPFTNRNGTG